MDLFVLLQKGEFAFKLGHLLGQDGENVLFFNGVVEVELGAERQAREDQLLGVGVAAWITLGHVTCVLELVPGQTEMVMLV